jgi:hypothetical protein
MFDVVDGIVSSSGDGVEWAPWKNLGSAVSRLMASQDGSYLVAQSADAIVVGRLDWAGVIHALPALPTGRGEVCLVAARHGPTQSMFEFPTVEVLVTTASASEIWVVDDSGLEAKRGHAPSVRAGAATADGFLVITSEGMLAELSPAGTEFTMLTSLGDGWLDVDAVSGPNGPVLAALRRFGTMMTASLASSADLLAAHPRVAGNGVEAVRINRQLGERSADARAADPAIDVWLVSANTRVSLATQTPLEAVPAAARSASPDAAWEVAG